MIRELIHRFSRSFSERRGSSRRKHTAPLKIWFDPDINNERGLELARAACVVGETSDMSRTGIGFLVSSIRINEKYLVNQDRILNVEIDLPDGKVYMRIKGCRYQKVGQHISTERFFVGAEVVAITGADKEIYEAFLLKAPSKSKTAASLEFEID